MNNKKLVSYSKYGYIFAIPFVLTFLIFTLYPIVYTFTIGFTDLHGAGHSLRSESRSSRTLLMLLHPVRSRRLSQTP